MDFVIDVLSMEIPKEPPKLMATLRKLEAVGTITKGTELMATAMSGAIIKARPIPRKN